MAEAAHFARGRAFALIFAVMLWRARWVITSDPELGTIEDGALITEGERIADVGIAPELIKKYDGETFEFPMGIIMPGLINAHTHAAMVGFRGLADDLPLSEWLGDYIWPAERAIVSEDFIRHAAKIAISEMLRTGTTLFVDMYFFEEVLAEEVKKAGMRAVLTEGVIDYPTPSARTPEEGLERTRGFIERWKGDDRVYPGVGLHAPYSCSESLIKAGAEMAKEFGVILHMHLSETRTELDDIGRSKGTTPVRFLDELGVLGPWFVGAHGVWVDKRDRDILAKRGAGIVHCPQSNCKLASGIAPVPGYMAQGVRLGLGTDGAASNNNLDMFDEMRTCALIHKAQTCDPTAVRAADVIRMATSGGAETLGLGERIGSLTPGKLADFIVIDGRKPHLRPLRSPESHVVYSASGEDVVWVVVGGEVLVEDGKVLTISQNDIDEAEAFIDEKIKEVFPCT
ncbi:MAG: amidohydrolase [candidate division WOR-3 bacterium]